MVGVCGSKIYLNSCLWSLGIHPKSLSSTVDPLFLVENPAHWFRWDLPPWRETCEPKLVVDYPAHCDWLMDGHTT